MNLSGLLLEDVEDVIVGNVCVSVLVWIVVRLNLCLSERVFKMIEHSMNEIVD